MPSYGDYLKIDELLALQQPASKGPEHDEMLFIVIHQVYELWFKEILHELAYLEKLLGQNDGSRARHTLKRILTILKVMVAQLDILETMTPLEFLSFRDRLEAGSGFQSHQFRELEFALGWKDAHAIERYPAGSTARRNLERRMTEPTLWDAFLRFLAASSVASAARRSRARHHRAGSTLPCAPRGIGRDLPCPLGPRRAVRAHGGPGRRAHGVALSAREDGAAHHRHQARAPAAAPAPSI